MPLSARLHGVAAQDDGVECVRVGEHAGESERRDLTEGEAGDGVGRDPGGSECARTGEIHEEQGGLGILGLGQCLAGSLEAGRKRAGAAVLTEVKDRFRGGDGLIEVAPHADVLGTLTGKQKSNHAHGYLLFIRRGRWCRAGRR